jgi:hypothetical protein
LILERTREGLASGAPKAVCLAGQRIHWGIAAGWKKGGDIRSLLQKIGLKNCREIAARINIAIASHLYSIYEHASIFKVIGRHAI